MKDDGKEFGTFIRRVAFNHPELYFDDAKRVCALVMAFVKCQKESQRSEVRMDLANVCERLNRKLVQNRQQHSTLTVPECIRIMANPLSTDLQMWNTANRLATVATEFMTDPFKKVSGAWNAPPKSVRTMRSEPPPAA